MSAIAETAEVKRVIDVAIGALDYRVEIRPQGYGSERTYVSVTVYDPALKFWRSVLTEAVHPEDAATDFEAVRMAFRLSRVHMRKWIRYWQDNRAMAAEERGGKRAYYTKCANKDMRYIREHAELWRVCKALWKEIARL